MRRNHFVAGAILQVFSIAMCNAHDLWIEAPTSVVRTGEVVQIAFKLGNCNDGRRDFTTNGLIDPSGVLTGYTLPSKKSMELISKLARSAKGHTEGYWTKNLTIHENGMTWFEQSLNQIIEHDGVQMRGVVTAKAFVIASDSLDRPSDTLSNAVLDLPIELVLESSPLPSIDAGSEIRVRLLRDSNPQESVQVSFLPQGIDLEKEVDSTFERNTDANGIAEFKPDRPGLYLITARTVTKNREANGPKETYYSASMTLRVSNRAVGQVSSTVTKASSIQSDK